MTENITNHEEGRELFPVGKKSATRIFPKIVKLSHIERAIRNPEVPIDHIIRLIALRIVQVIAKQQNLHPLGGNRFAQQELDRHIETLRRLQKSLSENEMLIRRETLDLQGPKFQTAYTGILQCFKEALVVQGLGDQVRHLTPAIQGHNSGEVGRSYTEDQPGWIQRIIRYIVRGVILSDATAYLRFPKVGMPTS